MKWLATGVIAICLAAAGAAHAQKKMYKCGSVFQDRPCEGPAPEAKAEAPAQPRRSPAQEEAQRKIRCENWGRQVAELVEREKATKSAAAAKGVANQRVVIEQRMKGDGCS